MRKRTTLALIITLFFLFTTAGFGQEMPKRHGYKKWIISALALTAANMLDVRSSAGAQEANPFLRNSQGGFSMGRAFAFKSVASGGLLAFETYLIRKKPEYTNTSTVLNFVSAGALAGVSIRNSRVR